MKPMNHLHCVFAAGAALLAATWSAAADDTLKVAGARANAWESSAPALGQQAGIFKKHGIVLDLLPVADADDDGDIEHLVVSGKADVGLAVAVMGVLRAYVKGDPVRIIGAAMTGSANYWYVPAASPVKTVKDMKGRSIAYPTEGDVGRYDVFDFMKRFGIKARPLPTTGAAATFNQVMAGRIDVGWAAPPFGVDAIEQGHIRVLARGNDVPAIRDRTVRVTIAAAEALQKRSDVLARFVQAYRETLDWMYSDPAAPKRYAELAGVSEGVARRLRDEFFAKAALWPDKIVGLSAVMKEAASLKHINAPLAKKQVAELIQIPQDSRTSSVGGWFRALSPKPQ